MTTDLLAILKIAIALVSMIAIALAGVHWSGQNQIPRTRYASFVIALRLTFVFTFAFLMLSVCSGMPVDWFLILALVVFSQTPFASLRPPLRFVRPMMSELPGSAIIVVLFIPAYVLKQFVLGFPEKDIFVLSPPQQFDLAKSMAVARLKSVPESDLPNLNSEFATVVATLKPLGKIEFNGIRYDATSIDGTMIDVGQRVQVCDQQNRMYVVQLTKN